MCAGAADVTEHLISAANIKLISVPVTNFTTNMILTAEIHCFSNKYSYFKLHCCAMLVTLSLRAALFWSFSQCRVVIRTDVSAHLTGHIFKGQAVQLDCLTFENWTGDVSL